MTPEELVQTLKAHEREKARRESKRALFWVLVIIPGIVVGIIALIFAVGFLRQAS